MSAHASRSGFWQVLKNIEVRTFNSRVGSQLTSGSFILYLDRGKAEGETKHGGRGRDGSIRSGHDERGFSLSKSSFLTFIGRAARSANVPSRVNNKLCILFS